MRLQRNSTKKLQLQLWAFRRHRNQEEPLDEVVHRKWKNLLEMANIVGGVNQVSSLSKKCVHTSGDDDSFYLSLLTCRSRKYLVSWLLCGWHWLPSQCRLANQTPSSIEITVESLSFLKIKGCMICCIWNTDCWHLVENDPNLKGYPTVSSSWNHISKLDASRQ